MGREYGDEGTTAVVCAIPAPSVAIYTVVTQSVVDSLDLSSVVNRFAMIERGLPLWQHVNNTVLSYCSSKFFLLLSWTMHVEILY
jgi:hypothetical protein